MRLLLGLGACATGASPRSNSHSWRRLLAASLGALLLSVGGGAAAQEFGGAKLDDLGAAGPVSELEAGESTLSILLGLYDRSDDGQGNPFLDEDLTVIEPVVIYDRQVTDDYGYVLEFSYDYVSAASIERLSAFEEQSGASGDFYVGLDASFRHKRSDEVDVGWHIGSSAEYDYISVGLGTSIAYSPKGKDATVTGSLNGFYDIVDIIRFDGSSDEGTDNRISVAGTLDWYQVLSPKMHGDFGITVSQQSGFLETPYNAVVIEDGTAPPNPNLVGMAQGIEVVEELPDSRLRTAVWGRVRRSLGKGRAVELGGRVYTDDWGIDAFELEPRYVQMFGDDWRLGVHYRYYDQSASKYFVEQLTAADALPEFRTQDADLGQFDSQTMGARLTWFKNQNHELTFGVDFTTRSNGLDHAFASVGWTMNL